MDDSEDQRDIELSSLTAIFPEIQRVNDDDPYAIFLDVPVNPSHGVVVTFPAATTDGAPPTANGAGIGAGIGAGAAAAIQGIDPNLNQNPNQEEDSHRLSYLPSIRLQISLSPSYPAEMPPSISISTSPPWLPADVARRLEDDGPRLWEEMGRDIVVFTYIDHVQQSAEHLFGLIDENACLEIAAQHKIAILDYDIKAKRAAFEKETFDCGVCLGMLVCPVPTAYAIPKSMPDHTFHVEWCSVLTTIPDPKKGSVCHRMLDCGHVFCVECLQDFYNNAIKEGDLATVRCLTPNCAQDREKKSAAAQKKRTGKKIRTFISPSELLQIPLAQEVVKRYVTLKYKTELESDKNTIYCPRSWCNGAARSKKHRKPTGLELAETTADDDDSSGSEDEDAADGESDGSEPRTTKLKPYMPAKELLAICEDCNFAFCSRCYQSWHGEFVRCHSRRDKEELTAEEAASLEYVKLHTTPCPTCAAPVQKTMGCNHMLCYRCQSHFCYLCSAWLDPGNPYQHFNEMPGGKKTSCYMRLWELEDGDGDDVDYGFAGGARAHQQQVPQQQQQQQERGVVERIIPEIEEPEDEEVEARPGRYGVFGREANGNPDGDNGGHQQVGVAREGPLVLRIAGAGNQPPGAGRGGPRAGAAAQVPPAAPAPPARGQAGQQPLRGQAGARGRRAGARIGGEGAAAARRPPGAPAAAGGGGAHRQNNRGRGGGVQQQRHNVAAAAHGPAYGQGNRGGPNVNVENAEQAGGRGGGDLDPAQEAWVRRFVQLALNDREEVLLEFDSDTDDDH